MKRLMKEKNKTPFLNANEALKDRQWFEFDATGKTLGRFASEVAKILMGKHKVNYTPNVDTGDGVIIVNAGNVRVTGAKVAQKVYRHYTGAIGGLRETSYQDMLSKKPEEIIMHAVKKMLPKTKLGKHQLKKLRIFSESTHPMKAQKPIKVGM